MPQEYSYNDLVKMQEQAIRRVRDMQERARITMQEHDEAAQQIDEISEQEETVYEERVSEVSENTDAQTKDNDGSRKNQDKAKHISRQQNPLGNLLNLDKDKAVILPLLLLLGKESSDNILLLALMYIMS